jgi:transcriptional regulator with XRE-family HTH domain
MPRGCQYSSDSIAIGKRIRELREVRGWSQKELAERVGSYRPIVGRIERGKHEQSTETILLYAKAFGVSPELIIEVIEEARILKEPILESCRLL